MVSLHPDVEASARIKAPVPIRRSSPIHPPRHGRRGNARRHRQPRAAPTGSRGVQWLPGVRRGGRPHGGADAQVLDRYYWRYVTGGRACSRYRPAHTRPEPHCRTWQPSQSCCVELGDKSHRCRRARSAGGAPPSKSKPSAEGLATLRCRRWRAVVTAAARHA